MRGGGSIDAEQLDWKKIYRTIWETSVPRHEYLLTQGDCHKRGCSCKTTMQRGDPQAALNLILTRITRDLETLEKFGMTPREIEEENYRQEVEN